jgi:L-iditol 2-dehydrogenase
MPTLSLPSEQTQSFLIRAGEVAVQPALVPEPGPHQVLIEVATVGICGSDVHYFDHGRIADFVVREPLVLGHEASGTIRAVGSEVTDRSVGQRVAMEPQETCGRCVQCLSGRYNLCPDVQFFATPPYDGAFCQYLVMPAEFVFAVPDTISDDAAGLLEPLSVGIWACRRAAVAPGTGVLVTGAGPIGIIAAQVARAYGADRVTVTDVNPHRLALAAQLGLEAIDVSATPIAEAGLEPDVLIECSGNPRATWDAFSSVARAGRVVLVGMGGDELRLSLPHLQDREITLTGAFRYANTWPTAIQLAASGRVDLDAVVTGHYDLASAEAALTAARADPTAVKVIVRPGG